MAHTQEQLSIWYRPLGRGFWYPACALLVVALIGFASYPFVRGMCIWYMHPSVTYHGLSLRLPFRWIHEHDDDSRDIYSVVKPSWQSTVVNSELTFTNGTKLQKNPEAVRSNWIEIWRKLHREQIGTAIEDGFTSVNGHPLLCSESKTTAFIQMQCISDDAEWMFSYIGSSSDAREADQIVHSILSDEAGFKNPTE